MFLLSTICFAQEGVTYGTVKINTENNYLAIGKNLFSLPNNNVIVKSKYIIDSVLFEGIKADTLGHETNISWEEHQWVEQDSPRGYSNCLVLHGAEGCSWNWFNGYRICKICLRKEKLHEVRWTEQVKSEYEKLDEKVREYEK